MVYFSDSPSIDFLRHDADQAELLKNLPLCSVCQEPIQDEFLYDFGEEIYCEECVNLLFRKAVEVEWD